MVTVRMLAQEVHRLESGGPPSMDSPFDMGYTMRLVRQAANTFLGPMILANLGQDDRGSLPLLIVGYQVDVQGEDTHRHLTLPDFFIQLPFNRGLKGIAPIEEPTSEFIPRLTPGVSHNLPCADAEQEMTYWQEGLTVYFDKEIELAKLLVKLVVVAPDSIGDDQPLPLYPEMQFPIIALVRQMYSNRPLQDKLLDGNADIGVKIPT